MSLRKAFLVITALLSISSGPSRAQAPQATTGPARQASRKPLVVASKKDEITRRASKFKSNDAPIGAGLALADPFFGGTTDSVILFSLFPLVAEAPLLRRLPNCTIEAGIASSATFEVNQRIENYEDRLHQVALLNTAADVFPHGCTDPVTGVASQPGAVFGRASDGNVYGALAEPDLTTLELTNLLTVIRTQGTPISSAPALTNTITLAPNSAVTLEGDVAVGDLNGDGQLDLIVPLIDLSNGIGGTSTNNSLAILLNTGNGTLGTPAFIPLNVFPTSVVIDDMNGDGNLDVIVIGVPASAGGMQGMEVFLGKGDGTFKPPIEGPAGFPSVTVNSQLPLNSNVHALTGDFNGDGKKDLIASTGDILFGKGDGTFTVAPTTLGVPGNAGRGITTADFNHDGKADLAVAVYPATINIYYGNGDGTFNPGKIYSSLFNTTDLSATDLDGDGNFDIVVGVSSGGLYLPDGISTLSGYFLLGRADGTFAGPLSYPSTAADIANGFQESGTLGLQVGDVTGNGKPDIVTWEIASDGHLNAFVETRPPAEISDGDVSYGAPINSQPSSFPNSGGTTLIDVNGDGKLDLVYTTGFSPVSIVSLLGTGDGTFGSEADSIVGGSDGSQSVHVFAVADFNGDSKPDVASLVENSDFTTTTLEFSKGLGNGQFATAVPIDATLLQPTDMLEADLNHDGKVDLIVAELGSSTVAPAVRVYLGKGDGTFAAPLVLPFPINALTLSNNDTSPVTLLVGDLRGIGKMDIIAMTIEDTQELAPEEFEDGGLFQVYLGNGDGTFQAQTPVISDAAPDGTAVAALADFNRDGKLDLIVGAGGDIAYFAGNGDGTFGPENILLVPGSVTEAAVADLNGDGFPDFVGGGGGIVPVLNVPAIPLLGNTTSTTTQLTSTAQQATPNTSITFTATAIPASGAGVPTGTVTFFDGATQLSVQNVNGSGVATFMTTALALGSHPIIATYNGDANFTISTSSIVTITIATNPNNPLPTLTSQSPTSATAGGPAFMLTLTGTNFISTSVVQWNGTALTTTFGSATQLTAAVPAGDIATAGTASVTVFTPTPGGGTSTPLTFTINAATTNPLPALSAISPSSAAAGGATFTLTATGTKFISSSVVQWNGIALATTFVSATQVTATVPASDIATAGTVSVMVFTPTPGGGTSAPLIFTINAATSNPVPALTTLSPSSATAGAAAFTLTVTGTKFVSASVVQWNGIALTTTFGSTTQLMAAVPATDIATSGTASVTVFTPTPGGGTSMPLTFTINAATTNPLPTLSAISPSSATAGGAAFTLTVTGTKFVSVSIVQWNGTALTTKFVSATQLTAPVPASDIATAGTASVTVLTPTPGGGTSTPLSFTISAAANNPLPTLTALQPATENAGGAAFTLTVTGTKFVSASTVQWNGAALTTTFVSATQLMAAVPATDIATGGAASVTISNPAPGGGTSTMLTFNIADYMVTGPIAGQTVTAGQPATFTIATASVDGTFSGTVAFTASGMPTGAGATFNPATVTPGNSTTMTITTTARTAAADTPRPFSPRGHNLPLSLIVLLGSLALAVLLAGKSFRGSARSLVRRFAPVAALLLLIGATGYIGGCANSPAPTTSTGTPAGTYTVTVTGTSGTDVHMTSVKLIVQ